jgi:Flp pilus assembly protein TadG
MATLETVATRSESGRERGQAVIELALTLPLLLLIVLGVFDFGLMFQKYEVVTNAAREGARVGVLPDYTPADAALRAQQYMAVGGLPVPPATQRICGAAVVKNTWCAEAVVSITTIAGSNPAKDVEQVTMTVEFDYEYQFVGPMMSLFGGGSLGVGRLRSVSTMRIESN